MEQFDAGTNLISKCISYKNAPVSNLLLGDSRIHMIHVSDIKNITHDDYFNFGVLGGNTASTASAFWYANSITKLKNVYIGVSFHTFTTDINNSLPSVKNPINPVAKALEKVENPLYFMSNDLLKQSLDWIMMEKFSIHIIQPKPLLFNDKTKWSYFLQTNGYSHFKNNNKYNIKFYSELKNISNYCKKNNIDLKFIIFPSHNDLHECIRKSNLEDVEKRFKKDIYKLGEVYDFDYPNEITNNRLLFNDPFHTTPKITKLLIDQIWGNCTLCNKK